MSKQKNRLVDHFRNYFSKIDDILLLIYPVNIINMSLSKIETELKFKLKKMPNGLNNRYVTHISQWYLSLSEPSTKDLLQIYFTEKLNWSTIKEARIRLNYLSLSGGSIVKCFLTLKSAGTLQRTELETEITYEQWRTLGQLPTMGFIVKNRYELPISHLNVKIEVDEYREKLNGLITAEVEYDPAIHTNVDQLVAEIKKYIGDDAIDVTSDQTYKNVNLAKLSVL